LRSFFDPTIFLGIARDIKDDDGYDEIGRWRTSIGRAYYSVFLKALAKIEYTKGKITTTGKIHQIVIDIIHESGYTNVKNKLEKLRDIRVSADYHLSDDITEKECNLSIRLAERIIEELDTCYF